VLNVRDIGTDLLIRELMAFDKDTLNVLRREVRQAANVMAEDVRGNFRGIGPALSNWGPWEGGRLDFQGSQVASGIKTRSSTTAVSGSKVKTMRASVVNTSPAGAVFMLAGSKSTEGAFIKNLAAKYAWPYARFMTTAYRLHIDEVRDRIEQALEDAAARFRR
jgi:hypothetical protein